MALVPKKKEEKKKNWDFSQDSASIGKNKNSVHTYLEQRLFGNTLYYGKTYYYGVLYVKKRERESDKERKRGSIIIATSSSLAQLQP